MSERPLKESCITFQTSMENNVYDPCQAIQHLIGNIRNLYGTVRYSASFEATVENFRAGQTQEGVNFSVLRKELCAKVENLSLK